MWINGFEFDSFLRIVQVVLSLIRSMQSKTTPSPEGSKELTEAEETLEKIQNQRKDAEEIDKHINKIFLRLLYRLSPVTKPEDITEYNVWVIENEIQNLNEDQKDKVREKLKFLTETYDPEHDYNSFQVYKYRDQGSLGNKT